MSEAQLKARGEKLMRMRQEAEKGQSGMGGNKGPVNAQPMNGAKQPQMGGAQGNKQPPMGARAPVNAQPMKGGSGAPGMGGMGGRQQ